MFGRSDPPSNYCQIAPEIPLPAGLAHVALGYSDGADYSASACFAIVQGRRRQKSKTLKPIYDGTAIHLPSNRLRWAITVLQGAVMAFSEFISSVKDRFSSPLGFSIAISWVIINYEFLVIVFSGSSAMEKIQLINHQVYYSLSVKLWCWLVLPVLTGTAYLFIHPYIDIQVSSFLENRRCEKEKQLLKISRTMPIAAETQFEFFQKYDEKLDQYKDRLQKVIVNRNQEVSALLKQSRELEEKSSKRLLALFCYGTRIPSAHLPLMIEYDPGTYSEISSDWRADYLCFASKPEFTSLLQLARESRHRPASVDELRLISAENITDTCIGGGPIQLADYLDLVLALRLVTRFEGAYNIEPLQMEGLIDIASEVAKIAASSESPPETSPATVV